MASRGNGFDLAAAADRFRRFLWHELWQYDLGTRSISITAVRFLQFAVMVTRGFINDRLLLRASALTYVTALSMIPLLVVVVALMGVVGGKQSLINAAVDQLTLVSPEASQWVLSRIQEVRIVNLGTLGGATLVLMAILALRHLESTLGEIWGVRQSRSWARRFADYLAVLVVAPILTVVAVSLWATLESDSLMTSLQALPGIGQLHSIVLRQLPQILIWVAFSFLYWFFPNTAVRIPSAIVGALVATVLFAIAQQMYVNMSVGAARYSVLFGGMMALPLVLTWLYVCWSVVLFGAEVAFAHQNISHYRQELRRQSLPAAELEAFGIQLVLEVGRAFKQHTSPPGADHLSSQLDLPIRTVRELLEQLEASGLVIAAGPAERDSGYLPARPLADTSVQDILLALRGQRESGPRTELPLRSEPERDCVELQALERVLLEIDGAVGEIARAHSLADLLSNISSRGDQPALEDPRVVKTRIATSSG